MALTPPKTLTVTSGRSSYTVPFDSFLLFLFLLRVGFTIKSYSDAGNESSMPTFLSAFKASCDDQVPEILVLGVSASVVILLLSTSNTMTTSSAFFFEFLIGVELLRLTLLRLFCLHDRSDFATANTASNEVFVSVSMLSPYHDPIILSPPFPRCRSFSYSAKIKASLAAKTISLFFEVCVITFNNHGKSAFGSSHIFLFSAYLNHLPNKSSAHKFMCSLLFSARCINALHTGPSGNNSNGFSSKFSIS